MTDSSPKSRTLMSPTMAAVLAAMAGMGSCGRVFFHPRPLRPGYLLAGVVVGALVTGLVYALLARRWVAGIGNTLEQKTRVPRASALTVFLVITGASIAIGACLVGIFYRAASDSGQASGDLASAFREGALGGAFLGLIVGLLLSIPASLIVWLVGRANASN